MKRVIFDCDNTFSMDKCDVDDGLALLYLMSKEECKIEAITSTYGNSDVELVSENTNKMIKDYKLPHVDIYRGGKNPNDLHSDASLFLANYCKQYKGEISLLATGSLTNIYGAYKLDNEFFENIKEIVVMGGITELLTFQKKTMDELNLSSDFKASYQIIKNCPQRKLYIITANNCLDILFKYEDFDSDKMSKLALDVYDCVKKWHEYICSEYGSQGFYNWDVIAAIFLMRKDLFENICTDVYISESNLEYGFLKVYHDVKMNDIKICSENFGTNKKINLPKMLGKNEIKNEFFSLFSKL